MGINTDGLHRFYIEVSKHYTNTEQYGEEYLFDSPSVKFNEFCQDIDTLNKSYSPKTFHNVWSRIAIPMQSLIIAIDMVFTQTIRAALLCFGSVITCDLRKLDVGVTDAFSIPIQAMLLPILASIAVISPKRSAWITSHICKKIEDKSMAKKYLRDEPKSPLIRKGNSADRIYGVFAGLVSVPTLFVRNNFFLLSNAVALHGYETLSCAALAFLGTYKQVSRVGRAAFKKHTQVRNRLFFVFHGTYGADAGYTLYKSI